ncbi:cobalt-precorrin-5B (C(1))-methyltransferase [Egibacter rhizosphaerae]|uniref:Cobalt-precorrin-5B C(1)-methyltransferase n=1 Tax=Egibacter rhizosphaerae TaxID=1670831 RepID=A0A411YFD3_9ACTN|nr:cobalt-precorrin-5B (C(1))-methyltransferase [Egibacter rhizosphaerae]QBI19817.1 cobalt-precorrin-5B (C(1))-methyltransferase [Egibacter rhizosphaerae]
MSEPTDRDAGRAAAPPLREPDLPRTAKDRPEARRTGWTTGTCAAVAAKAAALQLAGRAVPREVDVALPEPFEGRLRVALPVSSTARDDRDPPGWAEAVVVKDAGDDPDVTDGAHVTVRLERSPDTVAPDAVAPDAARTDAVREPSLAFAAGEGVGTVTKPGLGLEVGGPAINAVPRRMIGGSVGEILPAAALRCVISVPGGEQMAKKTTNKRLGIVGGISILGTTGVVRPFSTASWRASVEQQIDVLATQGGRQVVLATGGRSERAAMRLLPDLPEAAFVEVGDFTGAALRRAVEHGLETVRFVGMAGKLAKLAAGVMMTHWTRSKVDPAILACLTAEAGGPAETVAAVEEANTGRHAYELWTDAGLVGAVGTRLCDRVADNLARFVDGALVAHVALVDFDSFGLVAASAGWDTPVRGGAA